MDLPATRPPITLQSLPHTHTHNALPETFPSLHQALASGLISSGRLKSVLSVAPRTQNLTDLLHSDSNALRWRWRWPAFLVDLLEGWH